MVFLEKINDVGLAKSEYSITILYAPFDITNYKSAKKNPELIRFHHGKIGRKHQQPEISQTTNPPKCWMHHLTSS